MPPAMRAASEGLQASDSTRAAKSRRINQKRSAFVSSQGRTCSARRTFLALNGAEEVKLCRGPLEHLAGPVVGGTRTETRLEEAHRPVLAARREMGAIMAQRQRPDCTAKAVVHCALAQLCQVPLGQALRPEDTHKRPS